MKVKDSINYEAEQLNDYIDMLQDEIARLKDALHFYSCDCEREGNRMCSERQRKADPVCGWQASQALKGRAPELSIEE